MIVDVYCEDDTVQIARIISEIDDSYIVRFLEKNKFNVYDFSDEEVTVSKDSISGFYDTDDLQETNMYMKVQHGYELLDDSDDETFVCSESDDESEDESLVDEDEDEA
jgi:hypothetical protein